MRQPPCFWGGRHLPSCCTQAVFSVRSQVAKAYQHGRDQSFPREWERAHRMQALARPQAVVFLAWAKYLSGLLPLQHFQKRSLDWCLVLACQGFMPHQGTIRLDWISQIRGSILVSQATPSMLWLAVHSSLAHVSCMRYCTYTLRVP